MKPIIALFVLFMTFNSFAKDCNKEEVGEVAHKQLNLIINGLSLADTSVKEADDLINVYYWGDNECDNFQKDYGFLSISFTEGSTDFTKKTIRQKMNDIGYILDSPSFLSPNSDENWIIRDFLNHELGCLNGGSC